ncbi:MAG: peptide deformylase [Bacilli bacterium]
MLKIYKDSDLVLRTRAARVEIPLSEADEALALAMFQHIKESQDPELAEKYGLRAGVGLAAPQVGVSKQIIVVHFMIDEDDNYLTYVLANPQIISSSVRRTYLEGGEGCLSVDESYPGHVYRYHKIKVKAYDILNKKDIEINVFGYPAIVLQHEIDHLNGVLFYDRIDPANKDKFPDAISL